MASITYWNRLEPRPRSESLERSLSAEIRDPAWFLARQWQLGEFQGADAGSPAFLRIEAHGATLNHWRAPGGPEHDLDVRPAPGEAAMLGEPFDPDDVTLQLELVSILKGLLRDAGAADRGITEACTALQAAFPFATRLEADDNDAHGFVDSLGDDVFDGCRFYQAAASDADALTARFARSGVSRVVLTSFVETVRRTYGEIASRDPEAWRPDELRHRVQMSDRSGALKLDVEPDGEGRIDWWSFDAQGTMPARTPERVINAVVLPAHVRFRGMPNERFWDFEDARTDFGDVRGDVRDLGRMALIDFMLLHSTSWYFLPLEVPIGTAWRIPRLIVRDVFGMTTEVMRADAAPSATAPAWTMFSTTASDNPGGVVDYLVVPAVAARAADRGDSIEEVRFLRDDVANLAWAVEIAVPNGLGDPRPVRERGRVPPPPLQPSPETPAEPVPPPLHYRIQTSVPRGWVPFVPIRDVASNRVLLEMGTIVGESGRIVGSDRMSRILAPDIVASRPYAVREYVVPATGVRIRRMPVRSRWLTGSTMTWVQRTVGPASGGGASGLRFDDVSERVS